MKTDYKPEGYTSVSPYLLVNGASGTIDFLKRVFGATELRRIGRPETDKIMHAEVRIDDSVIMLADGVADWPSSGANVHVYVSDVDKVFERALEAGATVVQEPMQKGDQDRRGGVKDAGGTTWWIATPVG